MITSPYLLFIGNAPDLLAAKVANGIADWRRDKAVGQLRLAACHIDLGLPDMDIKHAVAAGCKTLVIGVANRGGVIDDAWLDLLHEALDNGLDIAAGLHQQLNHIDSLKEKADQLGRKLHDVRVGRHDYPIAQAIRRKGNRVLMVGTDCSVGKMYSALALEREFKRRGISSAFKATGQTGILIEGNGVPADAVISDFLAGAIEQLTPTMSDHHWDFIEGQGSLFHPSFSGVSMGLLHGAMPTAMVMCHEVNRAHMRGLAHQNLPDMRAAIDLHHRAVDVIMPNTRIKGICINTSSLNDSDARDYLRECEDKHQIPTNDPVRYGVDNICDFLLK